MEKKNEIKDELFSLYENIKNILSSDKLPINHININDNANEISSLTLISYIKELIQIIINLKKTEKNTKILNNNSNYIKIEEYLQLENQLIKLENDNKYYLRKYLRCKIQKDVLEMKLNAYMSLEEEYEQLKEKVRFEGGKFLDNDRKENEIIIIRRENSVLKKEIVKLEHHNKSNENKNKEYQKTIRDLQNNIEYLNKKVYNCEIYLKEKNTKTYNIHFDRTNSCLDLRKINNENTLDKYENSHKIQTSYNYNKIKNMKSLYSNPKNINFKNKKLLNFHSPRNDFFNLENNKFTNKTTNTMNSHFINSKNNKFSFRNEINNLKKIKNNSINIIKVEKDENKSLSMNKKKMEKNNRDNYLHKSKIKTFNKILNSKPKCVSPISCKTTKTNGALITKYIHRESRRKINNNSSQNA